MMCSEPMEEGFEEGSGMVLSMKDKAQELKKFQPFPPILSQS